MTDPHVHAEVQERIKCIWLFITSEARNCHITSYHSMNNDNAIQNCTHALNGKYLYPNILQKHMPKTRLEN